LFFNSFDESSAIVETSLKSAAPRIACVY